MHKSNRKARNHVSGKTSKVMSTKRKSTDDGERPTAPKSKMVQPTLSLAVIQKLHWTVTKSLLTFTCDGLKPSSKILALDLDGTIVTTSSGKVFPIDCNDWKLLSDRVTPKLKEYYANGFKLVIISNQAGIDKGRVKVSDFQNKIANIVTKLGLPMQGYFSILSDRHRKPMVGMWDELETSGNDGLTIDKSSSFYCGDAAGRPAEGKRKKDHSCSDRLFALNVGLPFLTPEQLWYNEPGPKVFTMPNFDPVACVRSTSPQCLPAIDRPKSAELIVLVGYPASGKSHFCKHILQPLGYTIVNRDVLGTWQKCVQACSSTLSKGNAVAVDNTNMDVESRGRYIKVARDCAVPVRCFIMQTSVDHCRHNEKFRVLTDTSHVAVNQMVFNMLKSKYVAPKLDEGFSEIIPVPFVFDQKINHVALYQLHLLEK